MIRSRLISLCAYVVALTTAGVSRLVEPVKAYSEPFVRLGGLAASFARTVFAEAFPVSAPAVLPEAPLPPARVIGLAEVRAFQARRSARQPATHRGDWSTETLRIAA